MTTKDLINNIRICKYCGMELSEDVPHGLRECHLRAVARITELEEKQRWRVVANGELPEEDGEYWVWFDDEFTGIKISGYCDYSKQNGWDNTERLTHWLPLPPNPESPNDTQTQTIVYGKDVSRSVK